MDSKMSKETTIKEIIKAKLCTGCGTCVALCPSLAIEITINKSDGTYTPRLNERRCKKCGICYSVCPGDSVNFKELNQDVFLKEPKDTLLGNYINCYVGYSNVSDIRYNSSSGGLVTSVLINALEEGIIDGALVTRMKKDNPLEPEPFIARTRDEIIEASKSKYCPVPANIALNEILNKEGKYAVVGLPCHIHGIRKAEMINKKLKERIVLHLSIFCSGVPNFRATEYLLSRLNLHAEEIKRIDYRGKGWPGCMSLYTKDSKAKIIPYPNYWNGLSDPFYPTRCISCIDWFSNLADISFGDAWLTEIKREDKIGTSTIISRSKQGDDILSNMQRKGEIELNPVDSDKIYESQPGFSRKRKEMATWLNLSKLFGKRIPLSNYDSYPHPLLQDYLKSFWLISLSILASKRSLWWLLDFIRFLSHHGSNLNSLL